MFCINCGKANVDEARFCAACGQALTPSTESYTAPPSSPTGSSAYPRPPGYDLSKPPTTTTSYPYPLSPHRITNTRRAGGNNAGIIIAVGVVVLLALICLIAFLGAATQSPNPFAGTYTGTWIVPNVVSGEASITISKSGEVTGTETQDGADGSGMIQGKIAPDGSFHGSSKYPGYTTVEMDGSFSFNSTGGITGNIAEKVDAYQTQPSVYTLVRQ